MSEMKEMVKIVDNTKKHPEDRQYLVCIKTKPGSGEDDSWEILNGRTAAYNYIKENIEYIDMEYSFILVEHLSFNERASIYAFMKHAETFYSDGFDIEKYIKGDWDEMDYRRNNDIDTSLMIESIERVDIESFMNGDINTVELN